MPWPSDIPVLLEARRFNLVATPCPSWIYHNRNSLIPRCGDTVACHAARNALRAKFHGGGTATEAGRRAPKLGKASWRALARRQPRHRAEMAQALDHGGRQDGSEGARRSSALTPEEEAVAAALPLAPRRR